MGTLRALVRRHAGLAALLILAALMVRVIVPAGFMVAADDARAITVVLCHDTDGGRDPVQVTIPLKKHAGPLKKHAGELPGNAARGGCPYATLSLAAVGVADAVLQAAAPIFLIAPGFAPVRTPMLRNAARLWPPRRGPPARA